MANSNNRVNNNKTVTTVFLGRLPESVHWVRFENGCCKTREFKSLTFRAVSGFTFEKVGLLRKNRHAYKS